MGNKLVHASDIVGVLDPEGEMLGPVESGGTIIAVTPPGCWGPMLTPEVPSGHEVTKPVEVKGAEINDAIVIKIKSIKVLSKATSSGVDQPFEGRFLDDPFVAPKCPTCGELNPETYTEGIGSKAIKCKKCNNPVIPFKMTDGYTMYFDKDRQIGVTLPEDISKSVAEQSKDFSCIPEKSKQYSVNILGKADFYGSVSRVRPMIGNIGTLPSIAMPSSHNAGDFGQFLVGAKHSFGIEQEDLNHRTDGHMDSNEVREGAVLICPVKVPGGGIYVGDVHAMQGDGEIAGHTTDVTAQVELQVELIKNCPVEGPILLPRREDLPALAKPYTREEVVLAEKLAEQLEFDINTNYLPIQIIGSGANLNEAASNGLERLSKLTGLSVDRVKNFVTIMGSIEIARLPGVVQVCALLPQEILDTKGLGELVKEQYIKE